MHIEKPFAQIMISAVLLATSAMTNASPPLLADIVNKYRSTANRSSQIDVTQEFLKHIPIGSTVDKAKEILVANGFALTTFDANGKNYLSGSKDLSRSLLGFDEARLTMTVVDGMITTSSGSIFRHTL